MREQDGRMLDARPTCGTDTHAEFFAAGAAQNDAVERLGCGYSEAPVQVSEILLMLATVRRRSGRVKLLSVCSSLG